MWNKIQSNDSVIAIHAGDTISQTPFGTLVEFVVKTLEQGYLSAFHNNVDGAWVMKHFPLNDLQKDNWFVKS